MKVIGRWYLNRIEMPYCSIFKSGLTIGTTGSVRPCCAFQDSPNEKYFDEDWRSVHNNYDKISEHEWLPECIECKTAEDNDQPSLRQHYNRILSGQDLEYWDLKINNTCNLSCKMCNVPNSSIWEQLQKVPDFDDLDDYYKSDAKTGWHKDVEYLLPQFLTARYVKFTGGEPFLIPQVEKIISYLVDQDAAQNVTLEFISNGTIDVTKHFSMFSQFKRVIITYSVDAVGKRYEYIRSGSNWETVSENIINTNRTKPDNTFIGVTCLPMILNINHMDELEQWCKQNNLHLNKSTELIYPDFLRVNAMEDTELKTKLIRNLEILDKIHNTDYREFL